MRWEGREGEMRVGWKEVRENIKGILREGQGRSKARKGRGWGMRSAGRVRRR